MAQNNNKNTKKNSNKLSSTKKNKVEVDNSVKIIGIDLASNVTPNIKSTFSQVRKPIVEQLRPQIQFVDGRNQELELWWNSEGYILFTDLIKNCLYISNDVDICSSIALEDFQKIHMENMDMPLGAFGFDYRFIRQKLWDEGINCKIDLECNIHFFVKQSTDNFDDCILFFPAHNDDVKSHLRNPRYLTVFAQYTGLSVEDVGVLIRKQYYNIPL